MKYHFKKKLIRFTRLFKVYNFVIENILKYSLITGAIISVIIVLISQLAFTWYVDVNYFAYSVMFTVYFILIMPITVLLILPLIMLINILFILMLHYKDNHLTFDEKNYLIMSAIKKNKIIVISAEKLSDIVMLPVETVLKHLNYMVVDNKIELSINNKGLLVYNVMSYVDYSIEKKFEGLSNAN